MTAKLCYDIESSDVYTSFCWDLHYGFCFHFQILLAYQSHFFDDDHYELETREFDGSYILSFKG